MHVANIKYPCVKFQFLGHNQYNEVVVSAISVPANSSRLFSSIEEAKLQPTALLRLESYVGPTNGGYLLNKEFDATKIKYDVSYCAENQFHEENSWKILLNVIGRLKQNSRYIQVIDIGCGQGEIVSKCEEVGISAIGFDPTLRQYSSNLIKHYYSADSLRAQDVYDSNALHVFVMRCVLPHINNPMEFLNDIFNEFPTSMVYLEFQNLDRILKCKAWYSFIHDHVNYFTIDSFRSYNTFDCGNFGEWSWICLSAGSLQAADSYSFPKHSRNFLSNSTYSDKSGGGRDWTAMIAEAESVIEQQQRSLNQISRLVMNSTLVVYSAAGKGVNFSYAAEISGLFVSIIALDVSENRHGKFMECSGVQVLSLDEFSKTNNFKAWVVILNKEHRRYARNRLDRTNLFITLPIK
jgi:hypothetical protein